MRVLVTGVTGLLGSATAEVLLRRGHDVVGFARDRRRVGVDVPVVEGDAVTGEGVAEALAGADVACYLIHSVERGDESPYVRDMRAARRFVALAHAAGVRRIVFLGIQAPDRARVSSHFANRFDVERLIVGATPESIALRTGLALGPASTALLFSRIVERSPVIPLGTWRRSLTGVVDHRDLAEYLAAAAEAPAGVGGTFDIAPTEVLSYEGLLRRMVQAAGRPRRIVRVPIDDHRLSGPLVGAVTGTGGAFASSLMSLASFDVRPAPGARFAPFGDEIVRTPVDDSLRALFAPDRARAAAGGLSGGGGTR